MAQARFGNGEVIALSPEAVQKSDYFRVLTSGDFRESGESAVDLYRDAATFKLVRMWLEGYKIVFGDLTRQQLSNLMTDSEYYGIEDLTEELRDHVQSRDDLSRQPWRWGATNLQEASPLAVTSIVEIEDFDHRRLDKDALYDFGDGRHRSAVCVRLSDVPVQVEIRDEGGIYPPTFRFHFPRLDGDIQKHFCLAEWTTLEVDGTQLHPSTMTNKSLQSTFPLLHLAATTNHAPLLASQVVISISGGFVDYNYAVIFASCRCILSTLLHPP